MRMDHPHDTHIDMPWSGAGNESCEHHTCINECTSRTTPIHGAEIVYRTQLKLEPGRGTLPMITLRIHIHKTYKPLKLCFNNISDFLIRFRRTHYHNLRIAKRSQP